jgi:hypothetical protein
LTADQAEAALSRLREGDFGGDTPLVGALLDRLGETGGVRRKNRAAKWFDADTSGRDERRAARQQRGTVAEQRSAFRDYQAQLVDRLEAATRGQMLKPRAREAGVRTSDVLTMQPDAMRANLSEEALRWFGEHGPPLSFDAWRYANLGARDKRAVASWQRRTGGMFSEHG